MQVDWSHNSSGRCKETTRKERAEISILMDQICVQAPGGCQVSCPLVAVVGTSIHFNNLVFLEMDYLATPLRSNSAHSFNGPVPLLQVWSRHIQSHLLHIKKRFLPERVYLLPGLQA